jgi:hypothetical protein
MVVSVAQCARNLTTISENNRSTAERSVVRLKHGRIGLTLGNDKTGHARMTPYASSLAVCPLLPSQALQEPNWHRRSVGRNATLTVHQYSSLLVPTQMRHVRLPEAVRYAFWTGYPAAIGACSSSADSEHSHHKSHFRTSPGGTGIAARSRQQPIGHQRLGICVSELMRLLFYWSVSVELVIDRASAAYSSRRSRICRVNRSSSWIGSLHSFSNMVKAMHNASTAVSKGIRLRGMASCRTRAASERASRGLICIPRSLGCVPLTAFQGRSAFH